MQDSIDLIFSSYFNIGIATGLTIGLITWFSAWCLSQVIHLFKAISR